MKSILIRYWYLVLVFLFILYHWNRWEVKGSENHYKFQSNLREDKDVLKEIKNTKK